MILRRAVKVSLQWLGGRDRRRVAALLQAYRAAVNFFVRLLWRDPSARFSTATSERLQRTRLSTRYRDQALKQAVEIVASTKKSAAELGITPGRPFFQGMAILDAKFVRFVPGDREHDLVFRLACLSKGEPVEVRTKRTRMLKKWLSRSGARLVQGCGLTDGELVTLWVELPEPEKREGRVLGVDVGVSKLLATSDGEFLGTDFRAVRDKIRRRRPGSKGRRRARRERDDLVCYATKRLPWQDVGAVAFEDLSGIKRGKRSRRGRGFRRAMAAWRPPLVEQRLICLAAENGAFAVPVPTRWNSTTCPRCRCNRRENRNGDVFRCVSCGLVDDADHVGALAAKAHGEALLPARIELWAKECAEAMAQRERRRAAAVRRGQATAEKWRLKRARAAASAAAEEDATKTTSPDSSSRAAQSPAARRLKASAPVRDQYSAKRSGGAPQNVGAPAPAEENPEGGLERGSRSQAAGRRGHVPPTRESATTSGQLPSSAVDSRVLAFDEFPNKP